METVQERKIIKDVKVEHSQGDTTFTGIDIFDRADRKFGSRQEMDSYIAGVRCDPSVKIVWTPPLNETEWVHNAAILTLYHVHGYKIVALCDKVAFITNAESGSTTDTIRPRR